MESSVKVGKRIFDYNTFAEAVKDSKTYSELCEKLGMNKTVQTTITALKEAITAHEIDIKHFTYKYTIGPERVSTSIKEYQLAPINQIYYDNYKDSFDKVTSFQQYKVTIGDFLEKLDNKDFATITAADIETYVDSKHGSEQTKRNAKCHIRAMMIYLVKNDIANAFTKASKEVLVYLI
jgi:hypothetical protein